MQGKRASQEGSERDWPLATAPLPSLSLPLLKLGVNAHNVCGAQGRSEGDYRFGTPGDREHRVKLH